MDSNFNDFGEKILFSFASLVHLNGLENNESPYDSQILGQSGVCLVVPTSLDSHLFSIITAPLLHSYL